MRHLFAVLPQTSLPPTAWTRAWQQRAACGVDKGVPAACAGRAQQHGAWARHALEASVCCVRGLSRHQADGIEARSAPTRWRLTRVGGAALRREGRRAKRRQKEREFLGPGWRGVVCAIGAKATRRSSPPSPPPCAALAHANSPRSPSALANAAATGQVTISTTARRRGCPRAKIE